MGEKECLLTHSNGGWEVNEKGNKEFVRKKNFEIGMAFKRNPVKITQYKCYTSEFTIIIEKIGSIVLYKLKYEWKSESQRRESYSKRGEKYGVEAWLGVSKLARKNQDEDVWGWQENASVTSHRLDATFEREREKNSGILDTFRVGVEKANLSHHKKLN